MKKPNRDFQTAWNNAHIADKFLFMTGLLLGFFNALFWIVMAALYLIYNRKEDFLGEAWFRRVRIWGIIGLYFVAFMIALTLFGYRP